ncbi:MAG: bifunctional DedA family/phosphatase PAP2 family protein [Patescibacteria group bacterium]|nr:bifunctional DedA family/phosphatase PAP2 family protein [Patescibacteria group bacterium]
MEFLRLILEHGGYWIVFVVSVLEATPVVGSFIPGHTIVFFSGFLAKLGILKLLPLMFFVSLGAICGDIIGYKLGKKYGYSFLEKYGHRFFIKKNYIEKIKEIMHMHSGKALILSRFNPIARPFTPYLAGAGGVHIKKFWIFNILGGISWAVSSIIIGYVFGASYEIVSRYVGRFIFIAIVLSILIIWGYKYINNRRHIFARYHLFTLGINIASLYVFFKMLDDSFSEKSVFAQLDVWFNLKMTVIQTPFLTEMMFFVTNYFSPLNITIFTIIIVAVLAYKKIWDNFFLFISSIGASAVMVTFVKYLVERTRPENALYLDTGYSFPSGHAVFSIVFFCLLFYILQSHTKRKFAREIIGLVSIFSFLIIGFSRVYLNVHWFSDVIGGFSLGLFIVSGLILARKIIYDNVYQ